MRLQQLILVGSILLLHSSSAQAQYRNQIYTRAQEPHTEALDRLNLRVAWRASLPSESLRDGIALVQWLDGQVFIQTKSSQLIVLDGMTGRFQWQTKPYHNYGNVYGVALNARSVYFVNGSHLYAYDRKSGILEFDYDMGDTVPCAPVADGNAIYVANANDHIIKFATPYPVKTLKPRLQKKNDNDPSQQNEDYPTTPEGRFYRARRTADENVAELRATRQSPQVVPQGAEFGNDANKTPSISILPTLRPPFRLDNGGKTESVSILPSVIPPYRMPDGSRSPSISALPPSVVRLGQMADVRPQAVEPRKKWDYQANIRIHFPMLLTGDRLLAPTTRNMAFAIGIEDPKVVYQFPTDELISAPLGQYGETAYIPTSNSQLYAVSIVTGRAEWRYTGGGPLNHRPMVTDDQVFVSGYNAGVSAIERANGNHQWTHGKSERVRAVNSKFVYTTDRLGNLYVLDRRRGLELTKLSIVDFNLPVTNHETDRLMIAANNGLLICLHDKDFPNPTKLQNPPPPQEDKKKEPMMPDMPMEKKDDNG